MMGEIPAPFWCSRDAVLMLFTTVFLCVVSSDDMGSYHKEVETPYQPGSHGSPHPHRYVRECQPIKYGNVTHHMQRAHSSNQPTVAFPITTLTYFFDDFPINERAPGHIVWGNSPLRTVSVLEPFDSGGCASKHRATTDVTARQEDCIVAVNAGFFNTHTGECYGNVVSNGRMVQNSGGVQNAHFGIREDGTLVFGYLSEEDVTQKENRFVQLVGGVGWLIRNGEIYVEESRKAECEDVEESGTVDKFFNMVSARTAVGSDEEGRIILATVDGQSGVRGISLSTFASWLLSHGVRNAVNLDGGGSATFVVNGSIVNYPSDHCQDPAYRCPRQVSTIICIHEPRCNPRDCNNHGDCIQGECHCRANWHGPSCDQLKCPANNCSGRGHCLESGCHCNSGYLPPDCAEACPTGWYGENCVHHCSCQNGGICDPITGECSCLPGYTGPLCEDICPLGFHGSGCHQRCQCGDGLCPCHHITGMCTLKYNDSHYGNILKVSQCLANHIIRDKRLVPDDPLFQDKMAIALLVATSVAATSILCNLICLCFRCTCKCSSMSWGHRRKTRKNVYHQLDDTDYTEEDDDL